MKQLAIYKIGLAVIGAFSLIIVILVMAQAGQTKQDGHTYKRANDIADKLNGYIDNHGSIPVSLSAAGIQDVPDSVTYHKLSSDSFKFCVDYKAASSGFDSTSIEMALITGSVDNAPSSSSTSDYLYLTSTHHKGNNCQTIKEPYLYDNYYGGSSGSGGTSAEQKAALCNQKYPASDPSTDNAYFACIDQAYGTQSPSTSTD